MPGPFPGMDPYLETANFWPVFQHQLTMGLGELVQSALTERYRLRFGTRTYQIQQALFTSVVTEEHQETFVEIRHRATDRLVTLIEVHSPANRTTSEGRNAWLEQRTVAKGYGANLVDIDLVLQGRSCLEVELGTLPDHAYFFCWFRGGRLNRHELVSATVQQRLPRVKVPLVVDDRELVVDLQVLFDKVYEKHFAGRIDYCKPPPTTLTPTDAQFVEDRIRQASGT